MVTKKEVESLAPFLLFVLELEWGLRCGCSVAQSWQQALARIQDRELWQELSHWWQYWQQNQIQAPKISSRHRRVLFDLVIKGLSGSPIYERLQSFRADLLDSCWSELEDFLQALPFRSGIILMVFQFPAMLVLLLGPMILSMLEALK